MRRNKESQQQRSPISQSRCKLFYLVSSILVVLMFASTYYEVDWGASSSSGSTKSSSLSSGGMEDYYRHDFSYDANAWEGPRGGPRIVVLAGPHKTASTTLQNFVSLFASSTLNLGGTADSPELSRKNRQRYEQKRRPHPSNDEWVWPLGYYRDYLFEDSMGGGLAMLKKGAKQYATLAGILTGRRIRQYMPCLRHLNATECHRKADTYYRALFRKVWEDEGDKNIVIGAEEFDTLVRDLLHTKQGVTGEDMHVSPMSGPVIDRLLGLFPWDDENNNNHNDNSTTTTSTHQRPPLAMEDIEIHVNYRTPRSSHVVSIWHQLGKKTTLRTFLTGEKSSANLYQANTLALALQFARKGIKTTIIDMAGVSEHEARQKSEDGTDEDLPSSSSEMTVIGGLQGVVACDILRMGRNNNNTSNGKTLRCDDESRLHVPGFDQGGEDKNKKHDRNDRDLTDGQVEEIEKLFEAYDCSVWKHLQKYQRSGTLRILYPSERLFGTCSTEDSENQVSFQKTIRGVVEIASRPYGKRAAIAYSSQ